MLDRLFALTAHNTTVRRELIAGATNAAVAVIALAFIVKILLG